MHEYLIFLTIIACFRKKMCNFAVLYSRRADFWDKSSGKPMTQDVGAATGRVHYILVFVSLQTLNRTPTMACKFTTFMGRHSLEIYLVHEFVFATFMLLFNKHCPSILMMVIAFSASVVIACVCNIVSESLKRWVIGIGSFLIIYKRGTQDGG